MTTQHQQLDSEAYMPYPIVPCPDTPLHILIRRRREELHLTQAHVAEALHVRPESVTLWEAGRRRMELCKLPRIAAVLQMNAQQLCAKGLVEYHPSFFMSLFAGYPSVPRKYPIDYSAALCCDTVSAAERKRAKSLDAAVATW